MGRKGFPESYDRPRLIQFLADVEAGRTPLACPVYSHLAYDIVADAVVTLDHPDIVIFEGLKRPTGGSRASRRRAGVRLGLLRFQHLRGCAGG